MQFPSHIVQKPDGFLSLDLIVTAVSANRKTAVMPPAEATTAAPQPAMGGVDSQEVADGVFWLTGGSHHSLAIAMRDHIIVVDTPNGKARASAVLTKAKAPSRGKRFDPQCVLQSIARMIGRIQESVDLRDGHPLFRLSHLHDRWKFDKASSH